MSSVLVLEHEHGGADERVVTPRSALRRNLTISWVVGIVAFTLFRLVLAQKWLAPEGLNIWVFGVIDLVTAVPYALGVAQVVTSLIDREKGKAGMWAVVAAVSFLAPYLYVAWTGEQHSYPAVIWWVLGILVTGFGLNAVIGVARRVRGARRQRRLVAVN